MRYGALHDIAVLQCDLWIPAIAYSWRSTCEDDGACRKGRPLREERDDPAAESGGQTYQESS